MAQVLCVAYPDVPYTDHEALAHAAVETRNTCWVIEAAMGREPLDYVRTFGSEWVARL